ncbi:MAG: tRNA (adenosine(37)-N6)-threonylcarbamoyltransferase complex ATPase subunit type 1 TsaE [Porphyromonas sp.]|nr:tRNA (adenosine(37)-N6)-threonylcarbamoyltransferase complex ATPase subunit type 1 TsaE [Porphyromonas sp.]
MTFSKQYRLEELSEVAKDLINHYPNARVFAFYANMGVGKTTLIKAICSLLGVEETTASPTFAIVNEYKGGVGFETVYHFDCYRLETSTDAFNVGAEDYLESGNYCFIEWPEVLEPFMPNSAIRVDIEALPDGTRIINASPFSE